jgi:hypothetical protein
MPGLVKGMIAHVYTLGLQESSRYSASWSTCGTRNGTSIDSAIGTASRPDFSAAATLPAARLWKTDVNLIG